MALWRKRIKKEKGKREIESGNKKRVYRRWFVRGANIDRSGRSGIWVKKMFGVESVTLLFLYEKFQRYPFYYSTTA